MSKRTPSPGMIVAVIALCLGLGGAAIAADLTKPQVKKIAKKQANKQIKKKASGLTVAHARTADSATTAQSATSAANVDGVSLVKVFKTLAPGTSDSVIATFGPFTLEADCTGGGDIDNLEVVTQQRDVAMASQGNGSVAPIFTDDGGGGPPNAIDLSGFNERGHASFSVAQANGTTYSGNIGFQDPNVFDGQEVCAVFGHVTADG